ncbi:MAG: hypothetical protein WEE20_06260 [Bacteroidota bacterium]
MGNSKVIWTAGLSLIIGLYAMGIKTAEQNSLSSTVHYANAVNLEELGKTGVQMAMDELSSVYFRSLSKDWYTKVFAGDTIRYLIKHSDAVSKATVEVKVSSNGASMVLVATAEKIANSCPDCWPAVTRSRWALLKTYASVM